MLVGVSRRAVPILGWAEAEGGADSPANRAGDSPKNFATAFGLRQKNSPSAFAGENRNGICL